MYICIHVNTCKCVDIPDVTDNIPIILYYDIL